MFAELLERRRLIQVTKRGTSSLRTLSNNFLLQEEEEEMTRVGGLSELKKEITHPVSLRREVRPQESPAGRALRRHPGKPVSLGGDPGSVDPHEGLRRLPTWAERTFRKLKTHSLCITFPSSTHFHVEMLLPPPRGCEFSIPNLYSSVNYN